MELVFLPNGQACYLKEKIGNRFIVNKIFDFQDHDLGWNEIVDSNDMIVDSIFTTPPVERISSEIKELQLLKEQTLSEISELETKKRLVKNEVEQITKTQITNSKFIINRTDLLNAKTLALFVRDKPMPIVMDSSNKSFRGLKVNLNIEISSGLERSWGYQLYYDYSSSGDYLCETYGILINPTQEEIDTIITKRLNEFEFSNHYLKSVDDKYLNPKLVKLKYELIETDRLQTIERLEKELQKTQEQLSRFLTSETSIFQR